MKRINIMFFPGWNESSSKYTERISKLTFGRTGKWKEIEAVLDPRETDLAICLGSIQSINKANQNGFNRERIVYIKREGIHVLPVIDPEKCAICYQQPCLLNAAIHWLDLGIEELLTLKIDKPKKLSAILSAQKVLLGHRNRINFVEELSKRINFDVYGKGHKDKSFNNNYCGPLLKSNNCKIDGLYNYQTTVSIENASLPGYFTEKINDCFLAYTYPLYYGCPEIEYYFPKQSFYQIKNLEKKEVEKLELFLNSFTYDTKTIAAIQYSRELLLMRYNIWNIVNRLCRQICR